MTRSPWDPASTLETHEHATCARRRRRRHRRACTARANRRRRPHRAGIREVAFPIDRTGYHVGTYFRFRRVRKGSGDLLRRDRARRRLEDHERRVGFPADLRRRRHDVDRLRDGVTIESRSGVGRHRRSEQPPDDVVRRRRLQEHRRRQVVPEDGPRAIAARGAHRDRSRQRRRRPRRVQRVALRSRR